MTHPHSDYSEIDFTLDAAFAIHAMAARRRTIGMSTGNTAKQMDRQRLRMRSTSAGVTSCSSTSDARAASFVSGWLERTIRLKCLAMPARDIVLPDVVIVALDWLTVVFISFSF